jgi:DNA-directed RNA polymerase specialized sigma24 family protein
VTAEDYDRACRLAARACASQRPFLSREDWEDVCQEAALAMWLGVSVTRVWWSAFDEATRLQGGRRTVQLQMVELGGDEFVEDHRRWLAAADDPEGEALGAVVLERVRACLSGEEWVALSGTVLEGRRWLDVAEELGVPDATVSRWRRRGLVKAECEVMV